MSTADTIYELVKTLPEEQANLVLKFTQFLQQQSDTNFPAQMPVGTLTERAKLSDILPISLDVADERHTTCEERLALSRTARGRFAHLPNTSESFAQRKQADIDWEDRNQ